MQKCGCRCCTAFVSAVLILCSGIITITFPKGTCRKSLTNFKKILFAVVSTLGIDCTSDSTVCTYPDERSLRFFILGDWGGQEKFPYTTRIQDETARSIVNASQYSRPHFYISTGDNFYERGVKSVDDRRFNVSRSNCGD
jgi:hypothetical protein